jgi:hypothetical protein
MVIPCPTQRLGWEEGEWSVGNKPCFAGVHDAYESPLLNCLKYTHVETSNTYIVLG